jgi:two-component system response regulator AtoC
MPTQSDRQPLAELKAECAIHLGMTLEAVEKKFIWKTLAATNRNKKQAAVQLGISRRALYNKLQKYRWDR